MVTQIGYLNANKLLQVSSAQWRDFHLQRLIGSYLAKELPGTRIMLLGPSGSGKGTGDEALRELDTVVSISAGDLIRREMDADKKFNQKVGELVRSGKLLSDDIFMPLLDKAVKNAGDKGIVLDWHPRGVSQLRYLKPILGNLNAVVYFDVPEDLLRIRVVNRLTCSNRTKCRAVFNSVFDKPKIAGKCDKCGSDLIKRDDDTDEKFDVRMKEFREGTLPVVNYYKKHYKSIFIPVSCLVKKSQKVNADYLLKDPKGGNFVFENHFVLNIEGVRLKLFAELYEVLKRRQ